MIGRRAFASTMAMGVLGTHRRSFAQAPAKVARIGWLSGRPGGRPDSYAAFLEGLREHGYAEHNVAVESLGPERGKSEQYQELAGRLVAGRPDIILASNPYAIEAVTKATRTIPIVAVDWESDPVARGWVASLARPGGNLTGFFLDIPEISGKQLQFLREIRPDLRRVAVLGDPRINELQFRSAETAAKRAGLTLHIVAVTSLEEIQRGVAEAARQRAGALLALTSPLISLGSRTLAEAAMKHRLPSICPFVPFFAQEGGLIAYGPDFFDLFRRAGEYVGRILKGTKVGDLPVQRPEKFELVLNVKTARALELTLPSALVQRADRVIE